MRKVALRGLFTRKLRLGLTALAIALGVTLIAGTYVFTDTINRSFDRIFTETNKGVDAAITPREGLAEDQGGTLPTVPASLLERVRRVEQVAEAEGGVFDQAVAFDAEGERLGGTNSPSFVASVSPSGRFQASEAERGRLPRTPGEAAIDVATAERKNLELGDTILVQGEQGRTPLRLVGLTTLGGADSFGGATVVDVELPDAQRLLGKEGRFDTIQAAANRRRLGRAAHAHAARRGRARGGRAHRPGGGAHAVRRDQGRPRLPEHCAARLRRHLALRRRVHHLQHLLDHGRRSACASSRCCARSAHRAARSCARC